MDMSLDEMIENITTPRQRSIEHNFRSTHGTNWIVYNFRNGSRGHISVHPNNPNNFHATVGNHHYGYDLARGPFSIFYNHTGRYNQTDERLAFELFNFFNHI